MRRSSVRASLAAGLFLAAGVGLAADSAPAPTAEEVEQLRTQLAAQQAQIDALKRELERQRGGAIADAGPRPAPAAASRGATV